MSNQRRNAGRRSPNRKNTFVTHTGNSIKINRSFGDRFKARSAARARRNANRLSTLPKGRVKRMLYRLQPKRLWAYWFSRDGLIMGLKIAGIGIVIVFVLLIGLFAYFRKDLPKLNDISGGNLGGSISYYDRTGTVLLWQDYNAVKRDPVQGTQISNYMKQATVAIEDKNFYHEGAFSITGILRAAFHDLFGGSSGGLQGASTITEQVVKLNENWVGNHTIGTKVKEIILAVDLSREYSKDTILTGYLNVAPYGGVDYGVEAAAKDYFNEDASQLTLAQSALLAAIPQSPSYYSPYSDPQFNSAASSNEFGQQALLSRKDYILDQMVRQHYITQTQADQAKGEDVLAQIHPMANKYSNIKAPYFVLSAKQELENRFGAATVNRGGWKVTTTLDMNLQNSAEKIIANNLSNVERYGADEEATVAEDVRTGQITALVGGVDFTNPDHGEDNYASGILIPPGSSFKPYDYTTLINNNNHVGAGSVIYDSEGPIPGYPCTIKGLPPPQGKSNCLADYDFYQPGPITLRYALGGSRNIPAVKSMLEAVPNDNSPDHVNSVNKVISTATAMMDNPYIHGSTYNCYSDTALTQTTQCYDSSAIGDGAYLHLDDHVNGLATLARLGVAIPHTYILKIADSDNKTIYQFTQPKGTQVVKPDSAYIVDNMASDPNASYLPGSCSATTCSTLAHGGFKFQRDNGWTFAVKTGTTNNGFDGLMTSWSPDYAVVSWVGNHTRNVELRTSMEYLTEPITRPMMEAAHAGIKPVAWTEPSDIKSLSAFVVRNHIHYGDIEPSPSTDLFPSWYVSGSTGQATSATIDKISNLTATSCTPPLANETQSNANVSTWNIDIFKGGLQSLGTGATNTTNSSSSGTDDVHSCSDPPLVAPSITVDDSSGNAIVPDSSGNYDCNGACQIVVALSSPPPDNTLGSSPYARYPVTVNLQVSGQTTSSQSVSSSAGFTTLTFNYTPPSSAVQVSVQLVDNALYSATSNSLPVIAASNNGNGNGNQGQGQGSGQ